jgi:acetyl-CoA C-acetyltransferase
MSDSNVWIVGGAQTDFARNYSREGLEIGDLHRAVIDDALADSGVRPADIGVIHVGEAFSAAFVGQSHQAGLPATVNDAFWGVPAVRHEAACATGSAAVLAAIADLKAGLYDCALVVGVEIMKSVPSKSAAGVLATAGWTGHESYEPMWPGQFAALADFYADRYGLDEAYLHRISTLNLANAKSNPRAQTRGWDVPDLATADDSANPIIAGRLRRYDCSQITDGGAAIVLVSDRFLREHSGMREVTQLAGWGHRTVGLPMDQKLERAAGEEYPLPHVREAFEQATSRANVDLDVLDLLEVHDCFSISEYSIIEHVGLAGPGEAWKAIDSGDIERGGRLPINPSGGLIGAGHPVGATGVRMVLDVHRQVTGRAGDYQVEGACVGATLNLGGSTTSVISFVVRAEAPRS